MKKAPLITLGLIALSSLWAYHFWRLHPQKTGPLASHTIATKEGPSPLVRSLRPNYPYSVIAGGAYSPDELRFAHSKDPVVRAHYLDFDLNHVSLVRLTDDHFEYVSYRVKNQVYWTKRKLRIPSGELLLTDGVHYSRARCGNRLSDKPHAAIAPHEPDLALSLPPVNFDLLPQLELAQAPPESGVPPEEARTAPVKPSTIPTLLSADRPLIPLESVWGGEPIAGRLGLAAGSLAPTPPVTSSPGGTSPVTTSPGGTSPGTTPTGTTPTGTTPTGTTPTGTTPTGTTPTGTTPIGTTPGGSPTVTPVATPEPGTFSLSLATLLFGAWAIRLRSRKS